MVVVVSVVGVCVVVVGVVVTVAVAVVGGMVGIRCPICWCWRWLVGCW